MRIWIVLIYQSRTSGTVSLRAQTCQGRNLEGQDFSGLSYLGQSTSVLNISNSQPALKEQLSQLVRCEIDFSSEQNSRMRRSLVAGSTVRTSRELILLMIILFWYIL